MRLWTWIWLLPAVLGGCGVRPVDSAAGGDTGVVVEVDTGLAVPMEADELRVTVGRAGQLYFDYHQKLEAGSGARARPWRLEVLPEESPAAFTVETRVLKNGRDLIVRRATLPFVPGRVLLLRLDHVRGCLGVICATAETCTESGQCAGSELARPEALPDFEGTPDFRIKV